MSSRDETAVWDRLFALRHNHNEMVPRRYALSGTVTLTFDLLTIFIFGQDVMMDYPCAKFGDFVLSRFGFIVRTGRQTDRMT